jgi:hypothetical protein
LEVGALKQRPLPVGLAQYGLLQVRLSQIGVRRLAKIV